MRFTDELRAIPAPQHLTKAQRGYIYDAWARSAADAREDALCDEIVQEAISTARATTEMGVPRNLNDARAVLAAAYEGPEVRRRAVVSAIQAVLAASDADPVSAVLIDPAAVAFTPPAFPLARRVLERRATTQGRDGDRARAAIRVLDTATDELAEFNDGVLVTMFRHLDHQHRTLVATGTKPDEERLTLLYKAVRRYLAAGGTTPA